MALTRSFLRGMGLTDEQVSAIVEAHADTVDALKEERDKYKDSSVKLSDVESELATLKKDGGNWQEKYEKEHADFESYKNAQEAEVTKASKEKAYKIILSEMGISEKRASQILRVTNLDDIALDKSGGIKGADKIKESIQEEYSEFIPKAETEGASTVTPPTNSGKSLTKEEIMKIKDASARQKAIAENMSLFH